MTARIRKMSSLVSPTVLSFVAGLKEATKQTPMRELRIVRSHNGFYYGVDQHGKEVVLAVPSSQHLEQTNQAKDFCEKLYGEGNVKVWKT